MTSIARFNSVKHYVQFVMAKGFLDTNTGKLLDYDKSRFERLGSAIAAPIIKTTDAVVLNLRNPVVLSAYTVGCIAIISFIYYPAQTVAVIEKVAPPLLKLKLWMVRFALYTATELTVFGLGMRALSRISNESLSKPWNAGTAQPIPIGGLIKLEVS